MSRTAIVKTLIKTKRPQAARSWRKMAEMKPNTMLADRINRRPVAWDVTVVGKLGKRMGKMGPRAAERIMRMKAKRRYMKNELDKTLLRLLQSFVARYRLI